jgi:ABC-type transport system involved in cytochrome c biogenesis ATPase subunit
VLAAGAGLWLLDEPTTALDEAGAAAFERALAAHRAAGGMAVIATHAPVGDGDAATLPLEPFARLGAAVPDPFADPGDPPGADGPAGGAS